MGIFQNLTNLLSGERRVPVDTTRAASALEDLVAQQQELGRQIDALRAERKVIADKVRALLVVRHATVQGQTLDVTVSTVKE